MSIYSASTSTPDLDSYVGRIGYFEQDDLSFAVTVSKARLRFGHLDLLITPVSGSGERWVEQHRVRLEPSYDNIIQIKTEEPSRYFEGAPFVI